MKIENELIELGSLDLSQVEMSGKIAGLKRKQSFELSAQQIEMLKLMQRSTSIENLVTSFLNKNVLIFFSDLHNLLRFLIQEELIHNRSFAEYFSESKLEASSGFLSQVKSLFGGERQAPVAIRDELQKIPFIRSLDAGIFETFFENMRVVDAPSGIAICQQGQVQRSLFILLKGQASVLKRGNYPKPRRVATLSQGSVFGEVGFFLGEPRTADVITEGKCQVVRLKYIPEIFDSLIQKETARQLHRRFWVIHALLKSEVFRSIPDDCFDALVFAGQMRTVPAGEWVCREGEPGDRCYIVVQGSLVVSKDQKSIRVLNQGDCFGEMALMVSQGKRTASVRTQTEALLLEIPFDRFYKLLSQNLMLALEFEKMAWQRVKKDRQREGT